MKIQEKMDRVEAETIELMRYMDSRELRADIGLSTLISVLVTVTAALDIPIKSVTEAMEEAQAVRDKLFSSEGQQVH
jgi:hypothetical protein